MTIPEDRLGAFIAAYERANGERLSREEALEAANRVLAFVRLLSQPAGAETLQTDAPSGEMSNQESFIDRSAS